MSAVPECTESVDLPSQGVATRPLAGMATHLGWIWKQISRWHEKRESRRALRTLTDAQLLDIGITRKQACDEASRSFFWD